MGACKIRAIPRWGNKFYSMLSERPPNCLSCSPQRQRFQAERTTAMLVVIVAVFLITELPQGLMNLAAGINPRYRQLSSLLGSFFDLLSLTNSAVNFVLCALMSHVFRRYSALSSPADQLF